MPPPTASPTVLIDLPAKRIDWLLLGLGLMTGMEFYTSDSMNLVLPDITGRSASRSMREAGC